MHDAPQIPGAELVLNHFGCWPDFQDSEIVAISMERDGPALDLVVQACDRLPGKGSAQPQLGQFCIIRFRCDRLNGLSLEGFNQQNAVERISFDNLRQPYWEEDLWRVRLDGANGVSGEILARKLQIVSLTRIDEPRCGL